MAIMLKIYLKLEKQEYWKSMNI